MRVSVTKAKGLLTTRVHRAEAADEVILTRHGRAVVRLAPVRPHADTKSRRALIDAVRVAGAAKALPGPDAARCQDFLYGGEGVGRSDS